MPGGTIIYDSSVIHEPSRQVADGVTVVGVPFTEIAADLGKALVKNVVALGALQAATRIFPEETFLTAHPPGAQGQVRADPAQRGGVRLGSVKSVTTPGN